jgi:hypothetical protein
VAVEGFWSVEVVGRTRDLPHDRYACHARGDLHANSIARVIMGRTRAALGFDLVRLAAPSSETRALGLGEFMPLFATEGR